MKNLIAQFNNKDYSFLPTYLQLYLSQWTDYSFIIEKNKGKIEISMLDFNKDILVYGYFYEDKKFIDIGYMDVTEDLQRKGLAKNLFKVIEFIFDKPLENNDMTTQSGNAFWSAFKND